VLTIVVQKNNRIWRGVLTVGSEGNQAVTVRLQQPKIAQTPRAQTTKVSPSGHKRFDTVMRDGIELYNKGWFGPAVGRFREAVSLDPRSPEANLWLARALIRSDRQAEARPVLEKVIELARTGPQADEAAVLLSKL
jgi:Flp pilus assembly protein TadD